MKIAYVNFKVQYDVQENLAAITTIVQQYGQENDCIVFPEAALQGYFPFLDESAIRQFSKTAITLDLANPIVKEFLRLAAALNVFIVVGIIEQDAHEPEKIYNSAVFFQPDQKLHVYRKVHLATNEPYIFHQGNNLDVVDTAIGRIGFLICYDICFPEAARTLALGGAQIIILLSAWGYDNKDNNGKHKSSEVFKIYNQARAVENQVLLVVANQAGSHPNMQFLGESKIVLPSGLVHSVAQEDNQVVSIKIDLPEVLLEERLLNLNALNLLKNRRKDTYHL